MTDTLIARLRNGNLFADRVEAADRIEELQAIINQPVPLSEWQKMEAERDQLRAEVEQLKKNILDELPTLEKMALRNNVLNS